MAWFGKGQGSQWQPPPLQVPDREKHHGWLMANRWDPAATVRRWRENGMQTGMHQVYRNPKTRMHLGFRDATLNTSVGVPWAGRGNGWAWTNEQTHVLVLGPPR